MSFLSFFKRKKKDKTPDVPDCTPAEDVLQTNLVTLPEEPVKFVALDPWTIHPKQPINITLVKGTSESKSSNQNTSNSRRSVENSNIRRDSQGSITRKAEITNVHYVHKAPPSTEAAARATTISRLYPRLDTVDTLKSLPRVRPKPEEPKSIHDMFIESAKLYLSLQAKILYAMTVKKKVDKLKLKTEEEVQAMSNAIKKTSEYQYDFNTELDVKKRYSHIQNYKKLKTFDDVKKCHQRVNEPFRQKLSNNKEVIPIFQSYRDKFMCYQGQKGDIIDCD